MTTQLSHQTQSEKEARAVGGGNRRSVCGGDRGPCVVEMEGQCEVETEGNAWWLMEVHV
jgi:hypothetical protein